MKNQLLWMIIILVFSAFMSCSQDELALENFVQEEKEGHFVSLDEALIKLMPFYNEVAGTTRSAALPLVTKCEYLKIQNQTRSSDDVSPYYVVSFGEDAGFAVLSADDRLLPVYAFSTTGRMTLADTASNPTLSYFFNHVLQGEAELATSDDPNYTIIPGITPDPINPNPRFTVVVRPLLPYGVSIWTQVAPYNKYCPNGSVVGCAALSIGQMCAFYEFPSSFSIPNSNGETVYTINWKAVKEDIASSSSINIIARFLYYLGLPSLLDMKYGRDNSTVDKEKITPAIKKLGFNVREQNYDIAAAKISLENGIPFVVNGIYGYYGKNTNGEDEFKYLNGGHLFVIDGLAEFAYINLGNVSYYVHCVWGLKNGSEDGYYYNPLSEPYTNILPYTYKNENGLQYTQKDTFNIKLNKMFIIRK